MWPHPSHPRGIEILICPEATAQDGSQHNLLNHKNNSAVIGLFKNVLFNNQTGAEGL